MKLTGKTKEELKYVYKHLDKDGKVFYVGSGSKRRPYDKWDKCDIWNEFAKNGYTVEIVDILPPKQAFELEKKIQLEIGLDNLVNKIIGNSFKHTNETKTKMSESLIKSWKLRKHERI